MIDLDNIPPEWTCIDFELHAEEIEQEDLRRQRNEQIAARARYYLSLPKRERLKHLREVKKRHPLVTP